MIYDRILKFYDTSSLLLAGQTIFDKDENFIVSSITLKELEEIKNSSNKNEDIKYQARILLHLLDKFRRKYDVVLHSIKYENKLKEYGLEINNDARILSDAVYCESLPLYNERFSFVTNDLSLKNMARLFFEQERVQSFEEEEDSYSGYKEIKATDEEMTQFYQNTSFNYFNLYAGEYLILKNSENEVVDLRVWNGETHRYLSTKPFNSKQIGKISPLNDDIYQKLAFDSLRNNQITMLRGPAGSGKSLCSIGYLFQELENHNLDKIIIFCNPVATINSARLGFYPGTKNDKLLDSQIGNFLSSKLGDRMAVEQLIQENKLTLLPLADIRGFDTTGMRAGVYITEAQNLDRTLMKLALQRIGEDCVCIIEGDEKTQVDMPQYAGRNNGMKRVSKVFRGQDIYGEVELKNIYRSKIGKIANNI